MADSLEETAIYSDGEECHQSFQDCISQLGDETPLMRQLTQDYSQRYDAWTSYLGVFAGKYLCLDHRLRKSPEIRSLVLQQLFVLKRNLVAATELLQPKSTFDTSERHLVETGDKALLSDPLRAAFVGVQDALDRLHRLGIAIRQTSTGSFISRTKQYYKDEDVDAFEKLAYTVLETMYPNASSGLLEQIKGSLSLKYQKFLYLGKRDEQYRRSAKLRQQESKHINVPRADKPKPPESTPALPRDESGISFKLVNIPEREILSSAPPDGQEFKRLLEERSEPQPHTASLHLGYASCPDPPEEKDFGTCHWCLQNPVKFSPQREWRCHVEKDWEPYICISEDCGADRVPPSFNNAWDWEKHMREYHSTNWSQDIYKNSTWICDIDHPDAKQFPTQNQMIQHLSDRTQHPHIKSDEIQTMARWSVIEPKRRKAICPICCYDTARKPVAASDAHDKEKGSSHSPSKSDDGSRETSKRSDRKINTHNVRFADIAGILDHDREPGAGTQASKGKDLELPFSGGQATSTKQTRVSLQMQMAKHVAGHLQTAAFRILSIFFLPPEPKVDGENNNPAWSGQLAQQNSSQGLQSVYQDLLQSSDDETIDPEYQNSPQDLLKDKGDNWGDRTFRKDRSGKDPKEKKPSLADQILEKFAVSRFDPDTKFFLPAGCIDELISREAISRELENNPTLDPRHFDIVEGLTGKIVDFVCGGAKKVFATAVLSGLRGEDLETAMELFMVESFTDESLPVRQETFEELFSGLDAWSRLARHRFCQEQWKFLAPVFSRQTFKLDLVPEHILPFIEKNRELREGAFSQVFRVQIHPAHQTDLAKQDTGIKCSFAIKEFNEFTNSGYISEQQKSTEEVWSSEVDTWEEIRDLNHPNLIQCIAAIRRGRQRCLMFHWADGGNLRDLWIQNSKPNITFEVVKDVIGQLRGMAGALEKLHHYSGQYHYRHGDIKPENILIFPGENKSRIGTFKIADLGSARRHSVATAFRERTSGNMFSTIVYQPPESITNRLSASSRLCDIWSMGCVTLELMVWLLYGYEELKEFNERIKGKHGEPSAFFEVVPDQITGQPVAYIHPVVQNCLVGISTDPECIGNTALGALLDLVRTKLLLVELRPRSTEPVEFMRDKSLVQYRTDSSGLVQALNSILEGKDATNENYWFTGGNRDNLRLPRSLEHVVPPTSSTLVQDAVKLSNVWSYPVDNEFANRLLEVIRAEGITPANTDSTRLCGKCKNMDFWVTRFRTEDTWLELESNLGTCDFCEMRWDASKHLNRGDCPFLSFERVESVLRMNESHVPVLSICRSRELDIRVPIQIGFPQLPEVSSESYFHVLRQWLKNCDENHTKFKCRPQSSFLPTRLIDVGRHESNHLSLYETRATDSLNYAALSHPWGPPPHMLTYPDNIEAYKEHIDFSGLPNTIRDAVETTRELGLQYLWIDCLCIVQGPAGDFLKEAMRMEGIFGSAYCVLSASSAQSQHDGFLNPRDGRKFVTFKREGQAPFYICRSIDDFNQDVLESPLNKRAWVMQERALSHRTIYFTKRQTYWECGEGVRCETLTRMENKLASFVADPNFPEKISSHNSTKGERIIFYQDLYRQYSRLALTKTSDRPIAIAGLEKRLVFDLGKGGFGVFDDGRGLLQRSLLWQRGNDEPSLPRIIFRHGQWDIPSWSWMAYQGGIDFLEVPLGGVDWHKEDIKPPWMENRTVLTTDQLASIELRAIVRDFNVPDDRDFESSGFKIVYDNPGNNHQLLKCVVMGKRKDQKTLEETRHYVLFVTLMEGVSDVYERVGVGFMPGKFVELNGLIVGPPSLLISGVQRAGKAGRQLDPSRFVKIR